MKYLSKDSLQVQNRTMFFLFYPNAAYALSFLLFPVTKVIHVPGCWFIHDETFIAHSAALAMFLWDDESSVMSFVPDFSFFVLASWDWVWQNLGAAALLGCPQEGPLLSQGCCSPSNFSFFHSSEQSLLICHSWALWRRWGFVLKALYDSSGNVLVEKHFYYYLGYPVCDRQFSDLQREIASALRASQKW